MLQVLLRGDEKDSKMSFMMFIVVMLMTVQIATAVKYKASWSIDVSGNNTNPWLAYSLQSTSGEFWSDSFLTKDKISGTLYESSSFDRSLGIDISFTSTLNKTTGLYDQKTKIKYQTFTSFSGIYKDENDLDKSVSVVGYQFGNNMTLVQGGGVMTFTFRDEDNFHQMLLAFCLIGGGKIILLVLYLNFPKDQQKQNQEASNFFLTQLMGFEVGVVLYLCQFGRVQQQNQGLFFLYLCFAGIYIFGLGALVVASYQKNSVNNNQKLGLFVVVWFILYLILSILWFYIFQVIIPLYQMIYNIATKRYYFLKWQVLLLFIGNMAIISYTIGTANNVLYFPNNSTFLKIFLITGGLSLLALYFQIFITFIGPFLNILYDKRKKQAKQAQVKMVVEKQVKVVMESSIVNCDYCHQPLQHSDYKQLKPQSEEKIDAGIAKNPCGHVFHNQCMQALIKESKSCPIDNCGLVAQGK